MPGPGRGRPGDITEKYHAFFIKHFGAARWKQLSKALAADTSHVALVNWLSGVDEAALQAAEELQPQFNQGACTCLRRTHDSGSYPPPEKEPATGLRTHYWLDLASCLPPLLLAPTPGHKVLDMCAAPGGKTLILAQQLFSGSQSLLLEPPGSLGADEAPAAGTAPTLASLHMPQLGQRLPSQSQLVANEVDKTRHTRLQGVLAEYLPLELLSGSDLVPGAVRVTCQAADKYWQRHEAEVYDRVLLDVPCSSDRHVLQQAALKRGAISSKDWSEAGCKKLAELQLQLLLAGIRALAPGGTLVYSTCSLATIENDDVITKALARLPRDSLQLVQPLEEGGAGLTPQQLQQVFGAEPTSHGLLCLPDKGGAGPMYVVVLHKKQSTANMSYMAKYGLQRLSVEDDEDDEEEDEGEEGGHEEGVQQPAS